MSRLTRDGTAETVSRDQILRHARGPGNIIFPVQLTTSRIGNLTRLIHTLLYMMTIHTIITVTCSRKYIIRRKTHRRTLSIFRFEMGCTFFADDLLLCLKRCMWLVDCDHTPQTFVLLKNPVMPTFIRSPNPVVDYVFVGAEKKVYNTPHIAWIIISWWCW